MKLRKKVPTIESRTATVDDMPGVSGHSTATPSVPTVTGKHSGLLMGAAASQNVIQSAPALIGTALVQLRTVCGPF